MTGTEPDRPQDDVPVEDAVGHGPARDDDDVRDDGPVIDPRDPLGLGDLDPTGATGPPPAPPVGAGHDASDQDSADEESADEESAGGDGPGPDAPDPDAPGPDVPHPAEPAPVAPPAPAGPATATLPPATDPHTPATGAGAPAAETPAAAGTPTPVPAGAAVDDTPGGAAGARPPRSGWARLGHAMRPRTTQGQLITAGLCALLGFALVVQVRQTTDTQLGALRQNDLVRLLDETTTRTDELEQESRDLQRERDELLSGSDRQQAALDAARRTAAMQGILTGRLPATGPGVRVTLTEPDGGIRPTTLLHVLEELRNAGAEAMELNGQRITASTAITGVRGAIEVDGTVITSPFRWTVIGDPDTIAPALEIPGGALARVRSDGGRGTVEKADRVDVEAVRELPDPVYATPDTDEG